MEYLPDLYCRVLYPKGIAQHWRTRFNIKVLRLEDDLKNKLPNEFKNSLRCYNHRNTYKYDSWYIDQNNYYYF